jgi:hypothetical protein
MRSRAADRPLPPTALRTARAFLVAVSVAIAASAAGESAAPARKTLPSLGGASVESTRVQGEIKHSTRGKGRGAVRLDVLSDDGAAMAVLLVPDASLDTLGLSLRPGERIDARGSLVAGKQSLLVATEVTVDGRVIKIRQGNEGKRGEAKPDASP